MTLTTRNIESLKPGEWASDDGRRGSGKLAARRLASGGVAFYFRYVRPDGSRDALALGSYDRDGRAGLSLQQAANRAGELSKRYMGGDKNLRAVLDAETREAERERAAAKKAAE
ncbi:MAG: hypothetical protein IT478_17665, partial [Xanthomonadales bacterium]|nr:hypothetical protein [Xanthomonadales bacterium]